MAMGPSCVYACVPLYYSGYYLLCQERHSDNSDTVDNGRMIDIVIKDISDNGKIGTPPPTSLPLYRRG